MAWICLVVLAMKILHSKVMQVLSVTGMKVSIVVFYSM